MERHPVSVDRKTYDAVMAVFYTDNATLSPSHLLGLGVAQ